MTTAYILGGARTPIGSFLGGLSSLTAPQLGARACAQALKQAQGPSQVSRAVMGQALGAGSGQAPARQVALLAGLPNSTPCTTVNKVCGSGMEAIILGAQSLPWEDGLVVAGGMESMSLAPHLLAKSRQGVKFGDAQLIDSIQKDGLLDVSTQSSMGLCAEQCAQKYGLGREQQDEFAMESYRRAQRAQNEGILAKEITHDGLPIQADEGPPTAKFERIPHLRPAFKEGGTITPANASSLNDGAAAVVLGGEKFRERALFKIVAWAGHGEHPTWFTVAPVGAIRKCLARAQLELSDIDLFEINEAFSVVTMACCQELGLGPEIVNIYGGAVSLGHPIGASGARIMITLMNALQQEGARRGLGAICIGGGEALAMVIERIG